jgi:hypothetical protein
MFENGDVIILHLISGQEVVAKLVAQEEGGFILEAPTYLMVREDKQSREVSVGYAHYLTCGDVLPPLGKMLMPYHAIILPRKAPERIAQGYIRATCSIQIAHTIPSIIQHA